MIAANNGAFENGDDHSDEPSPPGVLGDGALQPGKYNLALVRRAIREDWPIPAETRKLLVDQLAKVIGESKKERNKIAASRVLVAADSVNVKRESNDLREDQGMASDENSPTVHIHVGEQRVVAINDPEYLEYCRRSCGVGSGASNGYAGLSGDNG